MPKYPNQNDYNELNIQKYKIEHGIPYKERFKYPYADMEIGDSFFVPGGTLGNIHSSLKLAEHTYGHQYSGKTVPGGIRVWRVPVKTVKIDKDIPEVKGIKKLLIQLKVGESIFVDGKTSREVGGHMSGVKLVYNMRFSARTVTRGVRITRKA